MLQPCGHLKNVFRVMHSLNSLKEQCLPILSMIYKRSKIHCDHREPGNEGSILDKRQEPITGWLTMARMKMDYDKRKRENVIPQALRPQGRVRHNFLQFSCNWREHFPHLLQF